ncbi:hypothetical protein P3342_005346 [Pyrenophora teres f. teres]|nr:hypothetical protein P3342_005346 [Pyrenophora teres f. teres]
MASHGISRGAGPVVRSEEARQKELQQITEYRSLVDLVNVKIAEKQYTVEVLGLVTKLLNENPEYYTIWNHRRRVLLSLVAAETPEQPPDELIQGDLQLTFTLLRKFPKCYWIWNHRDWLLRKGEGLLGAGAARFYRDAKSLAESEFEYTTKMIKTNLSNFSAWHNRSQLIPRILRDRNADAKARRAFLDSELSLICEAINTDPFDQSIWFYHQYLLSVLSDSCPQDQLIVQDLTNGERQQYYEHEMEYIREILEDEADCKWIYEALLGLAEAYMGVESGTGSFTTKDMRLWLNELKRLDPLRRGRWDDLEKRLNL